MAAVVVRIFYDQTFKIKWFFFCFWRPHNDDVIESKIITTTKIYLTAHTSVEGLYQLPIPKLPQFKIDDIDLKSDVEFQ